MDMGGLTDASNVIQYKPILTNEWITISGVSEPPAIIGSLEPWTQYQFQIAAGNALGHSSYSPVQDGQTLQGGKQIFIVVKQLYCIKWNHKA